MKKSSVYGFLIFLFLVALELSGFFVYRILLLQSPQLEKTEILTDEKAETSKYPEVQKLSLFMVGDALIHSAIYTDADCGNGNYDFRPILSEFSTFVPNYDLAFYNQETILGGKELGLSSYPRFNSPYEVGDAFLDTGFNLVSLANNHTLDRGEQAILNSRNYWAQKQGVVTAGSYSSWEEKNKIPIYEKNGIRYALFAYTDYTNGLVMPSGKEYLVNVYSEEQVRNDIQQVKDQVDVIIVSMHWGEEYSFQVSDRQKQIASVLSDLGVHLIIGHHPHVVQPIDYVGSTLVFYSLGNFLSAQRGLDRLTGLMASLDIIKTTESDHISVSLQNVKAGLTYTDSVELNGYRSQFKVYPYQKLNDSILPNYQMYYNRYMDIVLSNQLEIERW